MTIETTEQIHEVATIREEYVHDGFLSSDDHDTSGWVQGEIVDFEIDEDDDDLDVVVRLPWDELHRYGYDLDGITSNNFKKFCNAYDRQVSEFESIEGEEIWLKVRYLKIDDDGEIDSGTRLNYDKVHTGPEHLKQRLKWVAAALVTFVVVMFLL